MRPRGLESYRGYCWRLDHSYFCVMRGLPGRAVFSDSRNPSSQARALRMRLIRKRSTNWRVTAALRHGARYAAG